MDQDKKSNLIAAIQDLLKDEMSKITGIKKMVFDTLLSRMLDIFSADCSDVDLTTAVEELSRVDTGYYREEDYLNYEQAMKILHFSSNRVGFAKLMEKKKICQNTFKNHKIGFKKSEIMALSKELDEEIRIRKAKEEIKSKKRKWYENKKTLSRIEKLY